MKLRQRGTLAILASLWLGMGSLVHAQGQVPFGGYQNQPPVSPYLNLNRLGAPPGLNYYNIVQPQLQFYSDISQLQQQANQLQGSVYSGGTAGAVVTGHPAFFGNYSHYYGRRIGGFGGQGSGQGGGGGLGSGIRNPAMQGLQGGAGFGSGGSSYPGAGGGVR